MPFLDTSDVLLDPDFATTFDVLRTSVTVGGDGETQQVPSTIADIIGVVTPAGTNDLRRMAEADRIGGGIAIHTMYRLTSGGAQPDGTVATADIVTWQGQQFTVFTVDDWTQFGAGFVRATATRLTLD